ncbi:MAG: acyl-CoA/acyl-ACP dehydrogenase [Steroidobacteraceae bacterium]|nr:acyl-CoA/acyl-ACP dehydrogenase [Steroidobacteraceae bacterium]MBP7012669.1 acyl-CoA/acyl-ACP dehydrogenase [Steroidobacteraceae bacterium]
MDFTFTEEQLALRESVSRFLMNEAAPELLREIWETGGGRSPELRAKIAAQGMTGLSVPEAYGGLGMGDVDWALISEELGYYAVPDSLADTAYVATGLLCAVPEAESLRGQWLPRIADGTARVSIEHPVNPWVADAHLADMVLVFHAGDDGELELRAMSAAELQHSAMTSIDASRRLSTLTQPRGASPPLLGGARAQELADATVDRAAVAEAGHLVGLAQRMLDLSVDYAAQRRQFGKPIGSFQAVKHHLADVVTRIEFARPVLYRAALALQRGERHRSALVSHAKLACADAAWTAARKAIQVHGASGYTWEVDLQMFMKRAWVLDAAWGDRAFHKARLGEALLRDDAPLGPAATLY